MNKDWYGVELDHPAPRVEERIRLVRELMTHVSGRFDFHGRFDSLAMAHYERRATCPQQVPILAAGVGSWMVKAVGKVADGFFGHTVASVENLADAAKPLLERALGDAGRSRDSFTFASQVIASADDDAAAARDRAVLQVGFYSTPKGYDALFPAEEDQASRARAREAFHAGDIAGVKRAGRDLVSGRAVFGTPDEVNSQLKRYSEVLDLAVLYPPSFGVDPADITRNEHALIEIAAQWSA
jgi:alkanesulfonate monooxygenase SsuD/methylene tetrahydromethanopterin reductase-like flavin-dependent oxidoreductase (luciferase family)